MAGDGSCARGGTSTEFSADADRLPAVTTRSPNESVLHRLAGFGWRYLVVLAAVYVTFRALAEVEVVVVPLLLAAFLASVLSPLVQWFKRRGWSALVATWAAILAVVPVVGLVVLLVVPGLGEGLSEMGDDVNAGIQEIRTWLRDGPLDVSDRDLDAYIDQAIEQARENFSGISSGLLGGATVAFEVVTGAVLALLTAFFYLKDGDRAYHALLERVSDPDRVRRGVEAAWGTLSSYVRGLATVGVIDAVFIGIGLAIVGTPLVLPLMLLVFFGAFFPIIGAFLSGIVAVLVTLVNGGVLAALVVLGVVVAVQQLEGHVIYPIVFKRALELHPLAILVAIAVGGVAFGIIGAFLAVPLAAMAVSVHQATAVDPNGSLVSLLSSRVYEQVALEQNASAEKPSPEEEHE